MKGLWPSDNDDRRPIVANGCLAAVLMTFCAVSVWLALSIFSIQPESLGERLTRTLVLDAFLTVALFSLAGAVWIFFRPPWLARLFRSRYSTAMTVLGLQLLIGSGLMIYFGLIA